MAFRSLSEIICYRVAVLEVSILKKTTLMSYDYINGF